MLVCVIALSLVVLQPAISQTNEKKVRICHATASKTNPYISNEPAIANNGDLQGGHLNHTGPVFPANDWGDIIPPYTYTDDERQGGHVTPAGTGTRPGRRSGRTTAISASTR